MTELQERAMDKLNEEFKGCNAMQKDFLKDLLPHLEACVDESEEFATQVMTETKALNKCYDFILEKARNHLNGRSGAVFHETVYGWADEYFWKDDAKEEAEKKAKEEAAKKAAEARKKESKKTDKTKSKSDTKETRAEEAVRAETPAEKAEPKKSSKSRKKKEEDNGFIQMNLMDMM